MGLKECGRYAKACVSELHIAAGQGHCAIATAPSYLRRMGSAELGKGGVREVWRYRPLAKISWGTLEIFGAKIGFLAKVGSQKVAQNRPPTFSEHSSRFFAEQTYRKRCYFQVGYPKCGFRERRPQIIFPQLIFASGL